MSKFSLSVASLVTVLALSIAAQASASLLPPSGGLEFWVKSDTGVTTSGGNVASWADQSGLGHNATSVTGALPTTSTQNVGDLVAQPVVAVTGGQSLTFQLPSANNYSGMTVLFVASAGDARTSYETVVSSGLNVTSGARWAFGLGSANDGFGLGWGGATGNVGLGNGGILTSNTFYMNGYRTDKTAWDVYSSQDDAATKFSDDLSTDTVSDTSFPTGNFNGVLGAEGAGGGYQLSGYIAEVLIYDHSLNSTEMSNAVAYLNDRYFPTIEAPEPTSVAVIGLGGILLSLRRRRVA